VELAEGILQFYEDNEVMCLLAIGLLTSLIILKLLKRRHNFVFGKFLVETFAMTGLIASFLTFYGTAGINLVKLLAEDFFNPIYLALLMLPFLLGAVMLQYIKKNRNRHR
jgi:hypothetical protein